MAPQPRFQVSSHREDPHQCPSPPHSLQRPFGGHTRKKPQSDMGSPSLALQGLRRFRGDFRYDPEDSKTPSPTPGKTKAPPYNPRQLQN